MQHESLLGTVLIAAALGASGCGSDAPDAQAVLDAKAETPSGLAQLVPQDAFLFLQLSSLDELDAKVGELMAAVDPEAARDFDATALLFDRQLLPGDASLIARDQPIGIAASLPAGGGMPAPTFIVPATDPDAYVASIAATPGAAAPVTQGDYVGITLGAGVAPSTSPAPITAEMPGGFVSARVDLTKVLATYRPIIDMALAQGKQQLAGAMEHENATGLDMTAMLELYFGAIQQVLDSAETLDLAVASGDGEVELGWALTAAAGSPMASFSSDAPIDLRELAGYLDAGSPIAAVFGADMPALMERMQPVIETLMTVYPAPMRDAMTGLLDDFQPLLPLFGSVMAADGAMDEQGMRFVYFLRPTDADALRDGYLAALRSENMQAIGFTPDTIEETEIGGVQVTSLRFDLDTEAIMTTAGVGSEVDEAQLAAFEEMMTAFYGEDGMLLRVASEGDRMIMVLGGDDAFLEGALARLSQKSTGPARGLERAISRIDGANPCFAYHLDLGRLMSGMSTFMPGMPQDMPELPPDISAPMTFYGAVEGRVWQGGALIDVAGFAELIQAVESR